MAQRTLINGTGYNVKGGRTLINGTGYAIKKGRTLIGGTGYDILFGRSYALSTNFTAASDILGEPNYGYSIDSTGCTLKMWLNARRSSWDNYDTNRNIYDVSIEGIQAGDTVSFLGTNDYPPASTELGVVIQGGTVYKSWNKRGTNVTYTFTATASGTMTIRIDDGDYDQKSTYLEFSMQNLTINGTLVRFSEMKGV